MIEPVLNRLRGTGVIKYFGTLKVFNKEIEIKFVGNHLYGLYLALVFGLLATNVWTGLAVLVAYLIGESKGWGEWVGALTRVESKDEKWLQQQYTDNEGVGFPYIHQIANAITKEQIEGTFEKRLKQYHKYATLALTLRGMFWWGLVYLTVAIFGYISYLEAVLITVFLGVCFPIACYLGKKLKYNAVWFKIVHFSPGWENQEVVYGLFQGLVLWYVIFYNIL